MLNALSSATVTGPLLVLKCWRDRHMLSLNDTPNTPICDYRSADGLHMLAVLLDGGLKVRLSDMELGLAELLLFAQMPIPTCAFTLTAEG